MKMRERKRVLVIAGFDPSGGAGLLMDVKVLTLFGFRASSVPTALTFQSSKVFEDWVPVDLEAFERMLRVTLEDEVPMGVKIGMLAFPEIIEITARYLKNYRSGFKWVVLDPVFKASLKKPLFKGEKFIDILKRELFPLVDVVTPNVREAEKLTGIKIDSENKVKDALYFFKELGITFPVITGFDEGEKRVCLFLDGKGRMKRVSVKRLSGRFHGTGCAFSSALLSYLLEGFGEEEAVRKASLWVYRRLKKALERPSEEGLKIFL